MPKKGTPEGTPRTDKSTHPSRGRGKPAGVYRPTPVERVKQLKDENRILKETIAALTEIDPSRVAWCRYHRQYEPGVAYPEGDDYLDGGPQKPKKFTGVWWR